MIEYYSICLVELGLFVVVASVQRCVRMCSHTSSMTMTPVSTSLELLVEKYQVHLYVQLPVLATALASQVGEG